MMSGKDNATSWLVLSVVTFSVFLEIGTVKGFSVLLPDLKEQLDTQTWIVGSSIAIITAFGYLLGLSSGFFVKVFSPRICVMTSGLIASIGLIVCSLATSPPTLLLGLMFTGFLLVQETVLVGVVPEYFDKYYKAAVGIYACGTGLGIVILPIITQLLLDLYGWRGALLILSGISFHSVPCGALIKAHISHETKLSQDNVYHQLFNAEDAVAEDKSLPRKLLQDLSEAIGLPLLTRLPFITRVVIPGFIWGYTLIGWMIYMVSFAVSNGLSIKQGSIVAASGGVGVVVVRISIPLLHKYMTYKELLYISSVITAISLSLTTFFTSYIALNIISLFFGLGIGCLGGELYISAKVNSEDSEHFYAIAWIHVAYGSGSILSGIVTGLLYDVTGSFTISFNILAAITLMTTVSLGCGDIFGIKKTCLGNVL
ncbi:monocarboxylate transporter 13-like [Amphiura filiformis]|uniref:monocarboxylate transporter 13-like n=1 Tax=Amphiura filiformis TaxID=82378 RepID=UPI003B21E1AA